MFSFKTENNFYLLSLIKTSFLVEVEKTETDRIGTSRVENYVKFYYSQINTHFI